MLLRALRPFTGHPEVRQVVVALPPGYAERPPDRPKPRITRTVDRERIWRAQTPQGFPREMLRHAYAQLGGGTANGGAPSDDAEVCERAGFPVELIPDSPYNFKITTADDFRIAEALARELR